MADHRLTSSWRQELSLLSPRALRQLTRWDVTWPVLSMLLFGAVLPIIFWLTGDRVAAVAFVLVAFANSAVELILAGRYRLRRLAHNERENQLLDLQARTPAGAPNLAYVPEHCGCVSRVSWSPSARQWCRLRVADDECKMVEHAHNR